jgi:hypothetical protein
MNARHIGNYFTILLNIVVISSLFLYKLPIERVELDLSHPLPPTVLISHPQTSQLTVSVWGGRFGVRGIGCPAPTPQARRVTVSHGGGRVRVGELDLSPPPPQF